MPAMPAGHQVYQVAIFKVHENLGMLSILLETVMIKELIKIHEYNNSAYFILKFQIVIIYTRIFVVI